jgi:hypothetical protein
MSGGIPEEGVDRGQMDPSLEKQMVRRSVGRRLHMSVRLDFSHSKGLGTNFL